MNTDKIKCCICASKKLDVFLQYNMPVFMGTVEKIHSVQTKTMNIEQCRQCKNIQVKNNIDPKILYQSNHNNGMVGALWKEHYIAFSKFIKNDVIEKDIFEISDPSAKIVKLLGGYSSWTIIEPNPESNINIPNVFFIKDFLTDSFKVNKKYDILVHSHYMEHVTDLCSFLTKCKNLLKLGGLMCFSIPNFDKNLNLNNLPNNILHFEHSIYLNKNIIKHLLLKYGFKILQTYEYKNHSLFFKCQKTNKILSSKLKIFDIKNILLKNHSYHLSNINRINDIATGMPIYLFGAHINSQFYVYNGLSKIEGIIDNSPYKQDKYLYGTNYKVFSPNKLKNTKHIGVICSHIGSYYNEIVSGLLKINNKIKIL
jgi:hypothetical protein